ncbi:MAG: PRC-barrel domain containing protein [Alphaproteobacteria bacterium]|nr:PRC-barrel domain containing protein [Alphaproteobacteria bacterium]MBM3652740.1 PRC-barrel domain containing protein [Alphaproteobacteria bacterium]
MNRMLLVALSLGAAMALAQPVFAEPAAPDSKIVVPMEALPRYGSLVSAWYKKPVYDTNEKKVGVITDMLFSGGEINAVMLDVGGFLGIGAKHVAIPAEAITITDKNNKSWLTINTTKDVVKKATGYKYDAKEHAWKKM